MATHKKIPAPTQKRIDEARKHAFSAISHGGNTVAERIYQSAIYQIHGEDLTREQVAAVMHALADYSLNQRMVSPIVADLAIAPLAFSEPNEPDLAHGLGRWFHAVGDRIARPEIDR
jgi:hypothetical protein